VTWLEFIDGLIGHLSGLVARRWLSTGCHKALGTATAIRWP